MSTFESPISLPHQPGTYTHTIPGQSGTEAWFNLAGVPRGAYLALSIRLFLGGVEVVADSGNPIHAYLGRVVGGSFEQLYGNSYDPSWRSLGCVYLTGGDYILRVLGAAADEIRVTVLDITAADTNAEIADDFSGTRDLQGEYDSNWNFLPRQATTNTANYRNRWSNAPWESDWWWDNSAGTGGAVDAGITAAGSQSALRITGMGGCNRLELNAMFMPTTLADGTVWEGAFVNVLPMQAVGSESGTASTAIRARFFVDAGVPKLRLFCEYRNPWFSWGQVEMIDPLAADVTVAAPLVASTLHALVLAWENGTVSVSLDGQDLASCLAPGDRFRGAVLYSWMDRDPSEVYPDQLVYLNAPQAHTDSIGLVQSADVVEAPQAAFWTAFVGSYEAL